MKSEPLKAILTPANVVTTLRIALIPVFVVAILAPWPSWVPDGSLHGILETVKPCWQRRSLRSWP